MKSYLIEPHRDLTGTGLLQWKEGLIPDLNGLTQETQQILIEADFVGIKISELNYVKPGWIFIYKDSRKVFDGITLIKMQAWIHVCQEEPFVFPKP